MSDRLIRTGLLLPVAGAAAVALLGTALPALVVPGLVAAAVVAAVGVLRVRRRGAARREVLVIAAGVAAGAVLVSVLAAEARRHPTGVSLDRAVVVELEVGSVAALAGASPSGALADRSVVRGEIRAIGDRHGRLAAPVTLFGPDVGRVVPGTILRARVLLHRAPPADQSAYLGSLLGRVAVVRPPPAPQAAADRLRQRFSASTVRLPGDGGALLPGLAIGDVTRVDDGLAQAMRDASLTHLTAVSGANCAVVTIGVLAFGGLLRLPRPARLLLAGAALGGFVLLVTPQPSVVRASVMAAVGLACLLTGRRTTGPPALALTVLLLLLLDPWIVWSVGFVLSVAATAGLLLLAPPLADRLSRVMPQRAALVLAVPIAAQAACQPVLALLQPGIPVLGVVANLLAEPAAPVATVLGLLACLIGAAVPPLGAGLALLAWLPAAWIGVVARGAARFPQIGWPAGAAGAVLAAVLVVGGVLMLSRRPPRAMRVAGLVSVLAAAVVLAGAAVGGVIGRTVGTPGDWTLAACDVGQGDGLVLNGGDGRFVVVDTGPDPVSMVRCLDRLGVHRVALLVLTHWDADHVSGARAIASRVRSALVGPVDRPAAAALKQALGARGAAVRQARRGDRIIVGRLHLQVLWPPDPLGGVKAGNAASVTLAVSGDGPSILMTGDLGEESEDAILAMGPVPHVDVVKVAHHGSSDQSAAFYAAAAARLGVISVGADNDYGHPTGRLLRILRSLGTSPVRTDEDGLVLVGRRDGRLWTWTEHPATSAVWTPGE